MTSRRKDAATDRRRTELVAALRLLNRHGKFDNRALRKATIRMLGREALPKVEPLSPGEIVELREAAGLSQAVLAGYMNVAKNTVSQWERGERTPTGAALKLLHIVKRDGIAALR